MSTRFRFAERDGVCIAGVLIFCAAIGGHAIEERELLGVPDCGFENGAPSWSIPKGSPFASLSGEQAASGDTSLKIVDTSADGGSNVTSSAVKLPSEGMYELGGKVFPVSGSGLGIYARLFDSEGNALPGNGHLLGLEGNERRWIPFSREFIAPGSADTVRIWIHSYNASRVSAYLDDFEVVFTKGRDEGMLQDLALLKERLTERELPSTASEEAILELFSSLGEDGSWPDIDYEDDNRASWKPSRHMGRILSMARAYSSSSHAVHDDPAVRQAILRAYDLWMEKDFTCPNWWYNTIGVPRTLYRVMLLVEDELTEEQRSAGIDVLKRAQLGMTGQNLVWVAEVTIARGCIENDPWVVMAAFRRIGDEIRISSDEGIQADFSFYQHGTQLYSGGYGKGFSIDCPKFAELAHGTAFEFPEEKVEILCGYLLEGQRWMVRGPTFDYSACGREIARKGGGRASGLIGACNSMLALDPPRKDEFELFRERLEAGASVPADLQLTGNQDFWRSELMTHHRPELYFSVRMTSPQVVQTETCNRENLHGQ
ncbi:MAG: polysaccharide lyase family 8 super-sandwich domain-containing protein, partial [Candidatus Hydrogenedentes bacterium]|nr:polysaccharide lyase family 8 super-sandwich domain-containing protein [Candidatus Hydrogenedentota bacterium]